MASADFDPYDLPKDVCKRTLPLIGMTGLEIDCQKSHQHVWEAFSINRRVDRIPLKFKLLSEPIEFLPVKQKRQSYEWYIPKGILKSNWIPKYLEKLPALIVLFWNLDWNDLNWIDKKTEISQKVQSLKLAIGSRNIRLAVVLIQNTSGTSLPGEDPNVASEKAAALCASCDLPPKHLFILPHSDNHLLGYTIRLENALSEIAGGFYLSELKGVKSHKDFLNKTNHQLLFIRHHFKIGFHNEMRNDSQAAIKHYQQCYHHLLEHRFTNTNLHEIRIIAAIVNYKICKLDFVLNLPRDAIEQFRKHIDIFRQRTGPTELIFEHYAWLSKQYQIFGEVFEEAVIEGLPAVQTQHPGFYYQQAAQYAVLRKKTALQVCIDVSSPEHNLLEGWENLEFYGQRPWRPGKHSLEPPEKQSELEGIKAICYHEANKVDHSNIIIPYFSLAITQFKKYRCPRIKRYLMVQMATEYNEAQDPSKALTLLNNVMWDYRSECWWPLLSSCSSLALSCAYQIASLQEYLALCLEVMGIRITTNEDLKEEAFENLKNIINFDPPNPPVDLGVDAINSAREAWTYAIQSTRSTVSVNMNEIMSCLEVRAGFLYPSSPIDIPAEICVRIRNHFNKDLQLYYITILTDFSYILFKETYSSPLFLHPASVVTIYFSLLPNIQDVDKTIKITGITVGIGTTPDKAIALHWNGTGVNIYNGVTTTPKEFSSLIHDNMENSELFSSIDIVSRSPKLDAKIIHDDSAMVWEWLPVTILLENNELATITDFSLSIGLEKGSDSNLDKTTQVSTPATLESKLCSSSISNFLLPNLLSGENNKIVFFVKAITAARRSFSIKISYKCEVEFNTRNIECPTVYTKSFSIVSKIPFQITIETQSLQFANISKVAKKEKLLIIPRIKCSSHVSIEFTGSSIGPSTHVKLEGENSSQVCGVQLIDGEEATDCFCVSVNEGAPFNSPVPLGQYLLYWKRTDKDSPVVSVSIGLPSVTVQDWGIWVEADLPFQGTVRVPITIAYELTNTGDRVLELLISMNVSDAFMFSGQKEVKLRILPGWQECLTYTLYPLLAGYVQLPRLCVALDSISSTQSSSSLDDFISRILPSHLYVMPQEKCDISQMLDSNQQDTSKFPSPEVHNV